MHLWFSARSRGRYSASLHINLVHQALSIATPISLCRLRIMWRPGRACVRPCTWSLQQQRRLGPASLDTAALHQAGSWWSSSTSLPLRDTASQSTWVCLVWQVRVLLHALANAEWADGGRKACSCNLRQSPATNTTTRGPAALALNLELPARLLGPAACPTSCSVPLYHPLRHAQQDAPHVQEGAAPAVQQAASPCRPKQCDLGRGKLMCLPHPSQGACLQHAQASADPTPMHFAPS